MRLIRLRIVLIPKKIRFEVIYKLSIKYNIIILCYLGDVSVSGYYKHRKLELEATKLDKEINDLESIKELVTKHKHRYGYRMITMLLRNNGVKMNHKKVYRIMKKHKLLATIRKKNPYMKILKATQEHRTMSNILSMDFGGIIPFSKLGTDITYIKFAGRWVYLSIVKDMISGEIITHQVSDNLGLSIVRKTLDKLPSKVCKGAILHSDQGFHYTHPSYIRRLKEMGYIQSMSRKGNCLDNAPTESFFGHFKDEIDLSGCSSLIDVESEIDKYMVYYNNYRPQRNKKKMTPVEYRNHLILNQY